MRKTVLIKVSSIFKPIAGTIRYVSGVGRSTYDLLKAIEKIEEIPFDIKLYGSGLSSFHVSARDLVFSYKSLPLPMKLGVKTTRIEPFFLNHIYKYNMLHIPHNYDYAVTRDMNFVVTIHDTCEYDMAINKGQQERIDVWNMAAKYSKKIVTCSYSSKADIIDRFCLPEEKVVVIPWGISLETFHKVSANEIEKVMKKYKIDNPYFFAVSCSNERKNIINLLKAYRNYLSSGGKAVMVLLWGNPSQDILSEYVNEIECGKIIFLNPISDEDMVALYNGALATMYPSRYEGFGFPILESFACGTPVMTCNNSSLSEVGDDLAVYVGENNLDEMTQAMEMFSNGGFDIKSFNEKVFMHVSKYSWANTANKYVNFYKNSLEL